MMAATGFLNYKRALILFVLAYSTITVVAFWFYLLLVWVNGGHVASAANIGKDHLYLLAEKYYPVLNLGVWSVFAWLYLRKERSSQVRWHLSLVWLAIVLPLDFVVFVLIPNPLALSAHDFYIEQFPWIYATYGAVAVSPFVAARFIKRER